MTIEQARWPDLEPVLAYEILRLRVDVFVVEQACVYPELDGRDLDADTTHLWLRDDDEGSVIAYLRVLDLDRSIARIGRVVTHPDHRSSGHARRLVRHALDLTGGDAALDAQSYLVEWYRDLGFSVAGPEFVEDGIPHVPMTTRPDALA